MPAGVRSRPGALGIVSPGLQEVSPGSRCRRHRVPGNGTPGSRCRRQWVLGGDRTGFEVAPGGSRGRRHGFEVAPHVLGSVGVGLQVMPGEGWFLGNVAAGCCLLPPRVPHPHAPPR